MPSAEHQNSENCKSHCHDSGENHFRLLNPLNFIIAGFLILGWVVWSHWPVILMTGIQWQKAMINQLSELLYTAQQNPGSMKLLAEVSFFYGIFHALGPGHGKVIVSTYLATHPTKVKIGILIPLVAALVQAATAVALVTVFLFLFHATMHELNATVQYFFHASAVGVILIGCYLIYRALKHSRHQAHAHDHSHEHHEHDHHEHHHEGCSCGHQHVVSAEALNQASGVKEYLALIFSIGVRPCTGALLVLFFAHLANVYWLGVISSVLMAVGTALTTTSIALLTVSGKKIVHFYTDSSFTGFKYTGLIVKIFAGCILILFGLVLLNQGTFGMSPVFGK